MQKSRKANGGVGQCPCYPYCDVMMERRTAAESNMEPMAGMKPEAGIKQMSAPELATDVGSAVDQAFAGEPKVGEHPSSRRSMMDPPDWTTVPDYTAGLNSAPAERLEWIRQNEKDWQKQKDAYPDMVKRVQSEVERACDQMEYEGSMMFDETPDRDGIYRMALQIERKLQPELEQWEQAEAEKGQEDVYAMSRPSYGQPPAQPGSGGNRPLYGQPSLQPGSGGNRPPYGQPPAQPGPGGSQPPMPPAPSEPGRPPGHNWFGDLVNVLLRQEMYHRRCRNRACRG